MACRYRFPNGKLQFGNNGDKLLEFTKKLNKNNYAEIDGAWKPSGNSFSSDVQEAVSVCGTAVFNMFNDQTEKLGKSQLSWEDYEYKALFFLLAEAISDGNIFNSCENDIYKGVNMMYSFKDIKNKMQQSTVVTLRDSFLRTTQNKNQAISFRDMNERHDENDGQQYFGKQGVILIIKNIDNLKILSIPVGVGEILIAPWAKFKIANYYYKYDYCGAWKEARTDSEIHALLEMDNGSVDASNVKERWQYIELDPVPTGGKIWLPRKKKN